MLDILKMNKKIIFSSGGTGGHIFPAINLMKYFSNREYDVLLVTDTRGHNFLKGGLKFKSYIINTDTPENKNFFKKIFSLITIFFSILRSIIILIKERPHLIFGLGGYVSFPISFASKFFNIPLVIYENNLVLGRTNKNLLFFSKKILLAKRLPANFPEKYKNKVFSEKDEFLKLALVGLVSLLIIQTFIHIGVNTRLLPTTGMTLPFLSYGGSSLIGSSIIAGIILNFTRKDYARYFKNE